MGVPWVKWLGIINSLRQKDSAPGVFMYESYLFWVHSRLSKLSSHYARFLIHILQSSRLNVKEKSFREIWNLTAEHNLVKNVCGGGSTDNLGVHHDER